MVIRKKMLNFVSQYPLPQIKTTQQGTMQQIERIKQMEQYMDRASAAVMELSAALDKFVEAQECISALDEYYGSDEWRRDFADDEAGLLPHDLKRGVLSEDGIWNLLSDNRELMARLQEAAASTAPEEPES